MAEPLRVCVVGCGRVSKSHLAGMLELPGKADIIRIQEAALMSAETHEVVKVGGPHV